MYPLVARFLGATASSRRLAATGYRYWRVFIETNNGDASYTTVSRLEMYSSALNGGGRIDRCVGGTPIFSTEGGFIGTEDAVNAFDDNNGSIWATDNGASNRLNCWVGYDFGTDIAIDRFAIQHRGSFAAMMPRLFYLQYSPDNTNWTTLFTPAEQTGWEANEMRLFTAPSYAASYTGSPHGAHRYWRIHCARSHVGSDVYSAAEVEFRATPGGSDQATGGTATAHSNFSGSFDAPKAFDDNNTTLWSAVGSSGDGWLEYDFGTAVSVAEVLIRARNDGDFGQTPRWGQIEFSDDDSEWSVAWEYAMPAFSAGAAQTTTDPAYV